MSAYTNFELKTKGGAVEKVMAASLAGVYTSVFFQGPEILFDVGVAIRTSATAKHICITHGHLDHIGALPSLLGIRGLVYHGKPVEVYVPESLCEELQRTLDALAGVSGFNLPAHLNPCKPGDCFHIRKDLELRCFQTDHLCSSLGYAVFQRREKLRAEFADLPPMELRRRKMAGANLTETEWTPYIAYTGDTLPTVFDHEPYLLDAQILVHECTYLDSQKRTVERAHLGGHTHIEELLNYAPRFKNGTLMLTHFSQLYKPNDVRKLLADQWTGDVVPVPLVPDGEEWWN